MEKVAITFRAVVYQEDGVWFAHCLELDIVGEGSDPSDAMKTLMELCELQVETAFDSKDLKSIFRSAPAEYWKMFVEGKELPSVPFTGKPFSDGFDAREAVAA